MGGRDLEHFNIRSHKFACFDCRKTFRIRRDQFEKQPDGTSILLGMDNVKCPDCGRLMVNMGLDFKVPKRSDLKQWEKVRRLYEAGITFRPPIDINAPGPGYRPKRLREVSAFLEERKQKRRKSEGERLLQRLKKDAKSRSSKK